MSEQDKLLKQLDSNRQSLSISRIPLKTKREFIEFADEEFCSDYGMTLKWLFDRFAGELPTANEDIYTRLDELENRIESVENMEPKEEKPKPLRTLSGEIIKKRSE